MLHFPGAEQDISYLEAFGMCYFRLTSKLVPILSWMDMILNPHSAHPAILH